MMFLMAMKHGEEAEEESSEEEEPETPEDNLYTQPVQHNTLDMLQASTPPSEPSAEQSTSKSIWWLNGGQLASDDTEVGDGEGHEEMQYTRSSTGEKRYTCHICGKQVTTRKGLRNHIEGVHQKKKNHTCEVCGKEFFSGHALKRHQFTHTAEKAFECQTCASKFDSVSILRQHINVAHLKRHPYTCTVCNRVCAESGTLTVHMRTHTGEKPYCCKACGKRFMTSSQKSKHVRLQHTGEGLVACPVCAKVYPTRSQMLSHARMHSGEKPYLCNVCDSRFTDSSRLRRHQKTHLK